MKRVILELLDGSYIYALDLPPFLQMPRVIVWGARAFVLGTTDEKGRPHYHEVFAWWEPAAAPQGIAMKPSPGPGGA